MASVNHPPISSLSDNKLNALCRGVKTWLGVENNRAKTGIPVAAVDELNVLQTDFNNSIYVCGNKGNRTQRDVLHKNGVRKKIQAWFKHYFTSGVIDNTESVSDEDRVDMGWFPIVPPRKEVPPPTAQTALQVKVRKNGTVDLTVSHNQKTLGKPNDAEGVELEYALEDPDINPHTKWHAIGKFTNVKSVIHLEFAVDLFGKSIWLRGRWYNHNGYASWSEVITFSLQKD